MKKVFSVIITICILLSLCISADAGFRDPVDGILMSPGFNPVVMHTDDTHFQYALYARDMDKMTNGDLSIYYADNMSVVSVAETGNYDMCSVYDTGSQVNISFMYEEYNESDAVKMFVITFEYTGEAEYPTVKVTNLAGTFLKSVADVVVIENDGDNDLTKNDVMGDADLNGYITAADARLALRYSSKLEAFSDRQLRLSDVNYDGKVNSADARLILRVAAGLATDF